jgi:hypothetical protein
MLVLVWISGPRCSISARSSADSAGLSRQLVFTTTAPGGGFTTNRRYVSSVSSSGLKLIQISEPGLRIVGITVRQDFFETFWASSTQRTPILNFPSPAWRWRAVVVGY